VIFAPPVVATSVAIPTVMLLGGLAILVAGLVLLTQRRPHAPESPPPADEEPTPAPTCDWSAELESASGERITLREASGRECCRYVFHLSEVTGEDEDGPAAEERLFYLGEATQIGRDGAVTPLQREAITRSVSSTPTEMDATLTIERAAGPSIGSLGWEQLPEPEGDDGNPFDDRAKQAWELHLEQLRQQGARPAVGRISEATRLHRRQQLRLHLSVTRACDAPQPVIDVSGESRVQWESNRTGSRLHGAEAQLAAWVLADDLRAVATSPTAPLAGLRSWHVVDEPDAHGISLVSDPEAASSMGEWSGQDAAQVTKPEVTVEMGCGVALEATAAHVRESLARLQGRAEFRLRVRIDASSLGVADDTRAADDDEPPLPSCSCSPSIDLTLGMQQLEGNDEGPADSTAAGLMRLDGRVVHVGRGDRGTWRVVEVGTDTAHVGELGWEEVR